MLVNGIPGDQISIHDRGLLYGDGVFRTLRIIDGRVQHWPRHYLKLRHDCDVLQIRCPASELLLQELHQLVKRQPDGIAKIIITRGEGERGYMPSSAITPTRILSLALATSYPSYFYTQGIKLHVCELRLSYQPALAGIKHLNRLENVLAAAEYNNTDMVEGLLLDAQGYVIEGTRSNLFMYRNGVLLTPDLSRCGVAGMQRERVMEWAATHGVTCRIEQFGLTELLAADEIFLVNSIIGLWPVRELLGHTWDNHTLAKQIQEWLNHASN